MAKKWTPEEEKIIVELRNQGLTCPEIAQIHNSRTEASIKLRFSKMVKEGRLSNQGHNKYDHYTNDQLLELVKLYRTNSAWREARRKNPGLPDPTLVARRFNSWNNAIALAGLEVKYGLDSESETTLYLVYFAHEDFYKIGITQNSVKMRFKGYPCYQEIDTKIYPNLKSAREIEKQLLNIVRDYSYLPLEFGYGRGHHECFQPLTKLASFDDILRLA